MCWNISQRSLPQVAHAAMLRAVLKWQPNPCKSNRKPHQMCTMVQVCSSCHASQTWSAHPAMAEHLHHRLLPTAETPHWRSLT